MVHTAPPTASGQKLSEQIVGEVIGRPGIDLTLVGSLSSISESSTDRLSLDSISGDVAVLDWYPVATTIESLSKLGFEGIRSPHANDMVLENNAKPGRKIYGFDLTQVKSAREILAALQRLAQIGDIKTVSLGGLGSKSPQKPEQNAEQKTEQGKPQQSNQPVPERSLSDDNTTADNTKANNTAQANAGPKPPSRPAGNVHAALDLDALVDQLDDFDV